MKHDRKTLKEDIDPVLRKEFQDNMEPVIDTILNYMAATSVFDVRFGITNVNPIDQSKMQVEIKITAEFRDENGRLIKEENISNKPNSNVPEDSALFDDKVILKFTNIN